jgi:hypothetical protein
VTPEYKRYVTDAAVLAQIGKALLVQPTRVEVRLPRTLADLAVAAWTRDEDETSPDVDETADMVKARHRAGTLALIGASVEGGGTSDGDDIVVELEAWFIGAALDAADDSGLLAEVHPPT